MVISFAVFNTINEFICFLHGWHRGDFIDLDLEVRLIRHLDLITDQSLAENGLFDLVTSSHFLILFLLLLVPQTVWHLSRIECLFQTIFDFLSDLVTLFLILLLDEIALLPHKVIVEPLRCRLQIVCTTA